VVRRIAEQLVYLTVYVRVQRDHLANRHGGSFVIAGLEAGQARFHRLYDTITFGR
jgi:hypothetical protein